METGKHYAMTPIEMDKMNVATQDNKHTKSIYYDPGNTARKDIVSCIVDAIGDSIIEHRERVDIRDTEKVASVVEQYIRSCQRTAILPSKSGLSRALGYSRQGVHLFLRSDPEHPSAEFLKIVFDGFSEMIDLAAMGGAIQQVYGIFLQKAQFEQRDNSPIQDYIPSDLIKPATSDEEILSYLLQSSNNTEGE